MGRIISVLSFRRGTGKTSTAANLAAVFASEGRRVAVVDGDVESPAIHILFGLDPDEVTWTFSDYLAGRCAIADTVYDVTDRLGTRLPGSLFLIPATTHYGKVGRELRDGYDVNRFHSGVADLIVGFALEVLLIDTHAGLDAATLYPLAMSDALAILLHPDQQDFQGTGLLVDLARELQVPRMVLIVNEVPEAFEPNALKAQVERTFHCDVAAVLPYADEIMALGSARIFVLELPQHPASALLRDVAAKLLQLGS